MKVAEVGGLGGAARRLGISASAVTRAINDLEDHLGVRLLTRTTRVVRLTEAGERYAEDCRRILVDLADADAAASGLHGTARGRLSVTAPALFGAKFVAPIVAEYLLRHPEIIASCWFVDQVVNMLEEGIDVAVRIGELSDSTMQATRVGRMRHVVCAAPKYLERFGTPESPDDLAHHHIVAAASGRPPREWCFLDGDTPRVVSVRPRLLTTTNDSAVSTVVSGFGLARMLSYQVADALRDGRLVTVLDDFAAPALPVHLLHREGRHPSKKVRGFIDLAIERLRADANLQ